MGIKDFERKLKFARMGDREAMATVMQREAREAQQGSYMTMIDPYHRTKYAKNADGTVNPYPGFFEGPEKQAAKTALMNLANAQQANAVAAGAFLNPDIMAVADAWGMDNQTIMNAMGGYKHEVSAAANALLNTITTIVGENNGALSTTHGGKFTPEEVEHMLEMVGSINMQAKTALEMGNDSGMALNFQEDKLGNPNLWKTGHPNFMKQSDGKGGFKDLSVGQLLELANTAQVAGRPDASASIADFAQGNTTVLQHYYNEQKANMTQCLEFKGGGVDVPIQNPVSFKESTGKKESTVQLAEGEEKETGQDIEGSMSIRRTYPTKDVLDCYSMNISPMAKQGDNSMDISILINEFGIEEADLHDYLQEVYGSVYLSNEDGTGYIEDVVQKTWMNDPANVKGEPITSVKLKHLFTSREAEFIAGNPEIMDMTHIDINNPQEMWLYALEIQAAKDAKGVVEYGVGDLVNPTPAKFTNLQHFAPWINGKDIPQGNLSENFTLWGEGDMANQILRSMYQGPSQSVMEGSARDPNFNWRDSLRRGSTTPLDVRLNRMISTLLYYETMGKEAALQ